MNSQAPLPSEPARHPPTEVGRWLRGLAFLQGRTGLVLLLVLSVLVAGVLWYLHEEHDRRLLLATATAYALGLLGLGVLARRLHRATAPLLEERALLHSLMDLVPDNIYFKDRESRFRRISRAFADRLGLDDPARAVGKTDFDFFTEDHARQAYADEQAILRTGQPIVDQEEREIWANGRTSWVSTTKVPLRDADGQIVGTLGISRDITARKQAEAVLRAAGEWTRLVVDTAHDAFIAINEASAITEWNRQAEITFGWSRAEALGRPLTETIIPPRYREAHTRGLQHFLATGEGPVLNQRIELAALRRDGQEFPVELTIAPIRLGPEHFFAAFVRDITKRKRIEQELHRAKEAAEAASRAKSEFLANMSHEIRTPMNGVLGMTELALDTELTREQRDYLSMVKLSAESLLAVINDILDFSKIEAQKLQLESLDFSLRDSLGDTMKALAVRAQQNGLELACHIHPEVPDGLRGDLGRLRQIIVNLVGNAIKFTERGEVVVEVQTLTAEDVEAASALSASSAVSLVFTVRDTGIGIPPEKQALVFEPFAQADASVSRQYGGTGLGLTISARLVALMGGRMAVTSTPGQGTTIRFTARLGLAEGPVASPGVRRPESLYGLPVLVVDDNATNRLILQEMLTNWRMRPTLADGAASALAALERAAMVGEPYPLVLLDGLMPDVDGFTLAEQIQQRPELAGTVLLMLSSAARPEDAARCRRLGIDTYLTKPVKQSELLDAILTARHAGTAAEDHAAAAAPPVPADRRRLHVLLAEDNVVNQRLTVRLLEKKGHRVVVANNGREALEALERDSFDVVLMDVQMPEMDGLEATQRLRERERGTGRRLPVIAMTAHAMKGDRERCLEAGMDGYVGKPVRPRELFEALAGLAVPPTEEIAPPAEAVIDQAELLDRVGGDRNLLREVVEAFRDTYPGALTELRQAVAARDAVAVQRLAHTLKGMVGNLGAKAAFAATLHLERLSRAQDLGEADDAYATLEGAMARLRQALDELLAAEAKPAAAGR